MNIYKFIDSKDIAKYLEEIHYEFSMPEMAFLVYICHTATLDDKFKAWQEMIDTLPDCRHETRYNTIESFHGFLREYMDLQKKNVEQFYQHEGFVYSYEWQYESYRLYEGDDGSREESNIVFSCVDKCLDYIKRELSEEEEKVSLITIYKTAIDENDWKGRESVTFNEKFETMAVDVLNMTEESDMDVLFEDILFEDMYFEFPTPFRHGDIVKRVGHDKPFVLDMLDVWDKATMLERGVPRDDERLEKIDRRLQQGKKQRDISDMMAWGYGLYGNDISELFPYYDDFGFVSSLELEYYPGKLEGENRILQLISGLMKRELDIEKVLLLYQYYLSDTQMQKLKKLYNLLFYDKLAE